MTRITAIWPYMAAMAIIVIASNFLVQFPFRHFGLGEILTWGAFTYPLAFLINDVTNRRFGVKAARRVVLAGFAIAVLLSIWLASPRIAIASGLAFFTAQSLDIRIFDRLRATDWWKAPLISTWIGAAIDTVIFFSLAFAPAFAFLDTSLGNADASLGFPVPLLGFGSEAPLWVSLALGDFAVKILIGLAMLVPYGAFLAILRSDAVERA